jgi:hypothetical protein
MEIQRLLESARKAAAPLAMASSAQLSDLREWLEALVEIQDRFSLVLKWTRSDLKKADPATAAQVKAACARMGLCLESIATNTKGYASQLKRIRTDY